VQGKLLVQNDHFQMLSIKFFDLAFILINVYGPMATLDKKRVWMNLKHNIQSKVNQHLIMGGDFNAILKASKKIGGISPPLKTIQDFL
jgi:hypothetical protein